MFITVLCTQSLSFTNNTSFRLKTSMDLSNQQIAAKLRFKIAIMGAARTGKTTFAMRYVDGDNQMFVDPITGVTVHPIDFRANLGRICFDCWVTTGLSQDGAPNLQEIDIWEKEIRGALKGAHGAIIMFDVTERPTYDHVNTLFLAIERVCPGIPVVLCGNKVDLQNRDVNAELLAGWLDGNTKYCEISALSNYNFERPFLLLAWMLVRYDIRFTERPALVPPEVIIDFEVLRRNEQEIFCYLKRARYQAIHKKALMPVAKRVLNRRHNRAPNAPLPDHDDELMQIVKVMMKFIQESKMLPGLDS